jgi:hypothetical protein
MSRFAGGRNMAIRENKYKIKDEINSDEIRLSFRMCVL